MVEISVRLPAGRQPCVSTGKGMGIKRCAPVLRDGELRLVLWWLQMYTLYPDTDDNKSLSSWDIVGSSSSSSSSSRKRWQIGWRASRNGWCDLMRIPIGLYFPHRLPPRSILDLRWSLSNNGCMVWPVSRISCYRVDEIQPPTTLLSHCSVQRPIISLDSHETCCSPSPGKTGNIVVIIPRAPS